MTTDISVGVRWDPLNGQGGEPMEERAYTNLEFISLKDLIFADEMSNFIPLLKLFLCLKVTLTIKYLIISFQNFL